MIGVLIFEKIRDGASRSEQTYLMGRIRSDQSGVKASEEKTRQIKDEREHHREREEPCQNRIEKHSEKIRVDSEKISAEQIGAISVVQKDAEQGEYPI